MRRLFRTLRHASPAHEAWPVVLLLAAVLVPAMCLLWFMAAAMRNERLAVRQKLAEAYRIQLAASRTRLQRHWSDTAAELERRAATASPAAAFAQCVESGLVDGVVLFDEQGGLAYPNTPSVTNREAVDLDPKWHEASRLEHRRQHPEAARRFGALARETTDPSAAGRAYQAEARCLVQAGQETQAVQLVLGTFGRERFRDAVDPHGRLIAANAELLALELLTNRSVPEFRTIALRLAARLADYANPALAAPQRRFLMAELGRLSPDQPALPMLAAEELAAAVRERDPIPGSATVVQRGALSGVWELTTPNRRVLALLRPERILAATRAAIAPDPALADVNVTLVPPDDETAEAFVAVAAGEQMPGWRLALFLEDREFLEATAGRQSAVYLWTGLLGMAVMGALSWLTLRLVRRQMRLARLKNDLAATVSHELKTPLTSMRVLVDTLLDSETLDEPRTREYLRLIARENERLGRLIQNFLTFSRMERRRHTFQFSLVAPRRIVDTAIESVRGWFDAPGCRLEVQVEEPLPRVMADADAVGAALINLLENAHKYSEGSRRIALRARGENGHVLFSVTDNGIGVAPRERKRIFQPFYQVDQRLSRQGSGCGLGLSIVHFIATAHQGRVSVVSQPGCGSTFTISIPAPTGTAVPGKEAIA